MERSGCAVIPILDAARRCGVVIKSSTLGRAETEARCPFCGDKPGRYHLFLNTVKEQYKCWLCGASGNSVSLYARLKSVSYAEAARDMLGGSNVYQMPVRNQEREPKPLPERHNVYREMLEHLTLSERHLDNLRKRGLSDERIGANMYRTLPNDESARRFLAGMLSDFLDVTGVPGFYTAGGYRSVAGKGGLMIPVRDMNGYIQGIQVRLDGGDKGNRYRWLSSRYKEDGTKSGTWIHVTGDVTRKTAYLTEGALKGDAASFHDGGALFVCVPGINSVNGLGNVIKALGVNQVLIAADMDKVTNPHVRKGFENISAILSKLRGVRVSPVNWNVCFKGIDDYYLNRRKALDINSNAITAYLQDLWQKEYPEQDGAWIASCEWEETVRRLRELSVPEPDSMEKAVRYREMLDRGEVFPPIVAVNGVVVDGRHRCRAFAEMGTEFVRVYQNKPIALHEAA